MTSKTIGRADLTTKDDGRTKVVPAPKYDASKTRRIAKGKKRAVVSKARAAGVPKRS